MPEAIHQEILFDANPSTIYDALTDSTKFGDVTGGSPTEINKESGGSFSLFGGMIAGRNIELVQNKRIVQAWRAANWEEGVYSVVKIELNEQGTETLLVLDHTGFPDSNEPIISGGSFGLWRLRTKKSR